MADEPWHNKKLSKGQVRQRLETLGCKQVEQLTESARLWVAPTGQPFSISYEDCDDTYLEKIIEQLEKWAEESRS